MTGEQEVLHDLVEQLAATEGALQDSLALLGQPPGDVAAFGAMSLVQRVAATALLKQVEQFEDGLARTFRTVLRMLGQSLKGLYPYDIALHMMELDVLDEAQPWVELVKLRNELVHEYPFPPAIRLERLLRACSAVPLLQDAAARVRRAIRSRGLLP